MKQKIVIKMSMHGQKSRMKAMKTVGGYPGVESTALKGDEKNEIEVVGDGIDAVELTILLRKNVGHAELLTVTPLGDNTDDQEDNKENGTENNEPAYVLWPWHPYAYSDPPYPIYGVGIPSNEPD